MNGSEEWGFNWWSVGACASRSVSAFFQAVCPDFVAYNLMIERPPVFREGFRHEQVVPPELKGFPIITNCRNPYSKLVCEYNHYEIQRSLEKRPIDTFPDYIKMYKLCYHKLR